MRRDWGRFWFEPAPAARLGIARAFVFGGLVSVYVRTDVSAYASVSPVFYGASWFRPPIAPSAWLVAAQRAFLLALALGCVGLFTRAATAAAFVLGAYLLGIDSNFGRVRHNDLPVVLALAIFAVSRAGDAFSLDARRQGARPTASTAGRSGPCRSRSRPRSSRRGSRSSGTAVSTGSRRTTCGSR